MASIEVEDNSPRYERPLLVTIIAVLSVLAGILFIIAGTLSAGIWTTLNEISIGGMLPESMVGSLQLLSYIVIVSGVDTALQGWGLWKMKPWAWIMTAFFLLTTIFLAVHMYGSNQTSTSLELSMMIVIILIAGLLLAYLVKRKKYFNLDMLSTKTTLMIIGGLVTYSIILLIATEMASTTMIESFYEVVLNKGLHSV